MIIGYLAILLMGITLGVLGAGGSILTVPIIVYLFKINPVLSTSYSLLLVGFTALIGSFIYYKKKQIDFSIAIKFAIPSLISVYLTRRFLLPAIPENFEILSIILNKDLLILLLFAAIMFMTSIFMINDSSQKLSKSKVKNLSPIIKNLLIIIEAIIVGIITAIIGAGGGFLIVPALVLLNKINVKSAIGSSLFIIALKSLIGFVGDLQNDLDLDFFLAINLMILSACGMLIGTFLSKYIDANHLKKGFGYFVMITSILILIKETL